MINWKDHLKTSIRAAAPEAPAPKVGEFGMEIDQLRAAAKVYDARSDEFAQGKGATCRDIAEKLMKFGSFASDRQRDFAMKLIEWAKPRDRRPELGTSVQRLYTVMQKHSTFHAEPLKLQRKNQDTLCWIIWKGQCVGKIENGTATLFAKRLGEDIAAVQALLVEFDTNPLEAAKKYGKLSGRCCSCGRDLTDPASIADGIGPICAQKFS